MTDQMLPPDQIAANIRKMLDNDITHYHNFGVYWYFVKALLKRYYDIHQMPILGDFEQEDVIARMPEYDSFEDAMFDALLFARANQRDNMNSATSIAPDDEPVTLFDEDIGL
jgi:hypothetical protein